MMNPQLITLIQNLEQEITLISAPRKQALQSLAQNIQSDLAQFGFAKLNFVCTHNSRRSQLGEIWLRAAAAYYHIENLHTYSGGTESTAFNHRMVAALQRAGFPLQALDHWDNPKYLAPLVETAPDHLLMFSKKYDDSYNPKKDFIAVMVCDQADADCPFVPGTSTRVSLPYLDPKAFDDTPQEAQAYDDKVRELGREMLFLGRLINTK